MSAMEWNTPATFPRVYEELQVPGFFEFFTDELLDRAALAGGENVLDVATGTGIILRHARARHPDLGRLAGLDLTPGMLEVARERTAGLDIEFVEGDAQALPFEDDSFDVVTCQQGLQFFPDRERALREFVRVLKPEGRAVVACWTEIEESPGHHVFAEVLGRHFPEREPVAHAPFALADSAALEGLLTGVGFARVSTERVEGFARFSSPEEFTRSFLEGTPLAVAMADASPEERDALAREVASLVRERVGDPVAAPMVTHIAVALL